MTMIIVGADCADCVHCTAINDENPARIKVYCNHDDKYRWYGQCIPCENKQKRKANEHKGEEETAD